jgi:hypothetical protein
MLSIRRTRLLWVSPKHLRNNQLAIPSSGTCNAFSVVEPGERLAPWLTTQRSQH